MGTIDTIKHNHIAAHLSDSKSIIYSWLCRERMSIVMMLWFHCINVCCMSLPWGYGLRLRCSSCPCAAEVDWDEQIEDVVATSVTSQGQRSLVFHAYFFFSVWHSCPLHRSIYSIYCCALTHICANSFFWHNSMRTVANMRSNRMHSTPYKSQYNAHFHRRRRESLRWRTINLDHGEETP